MNEVKDKLNVPIKGLLFFLVLITFASCSNQKKVVVKNKQGITEQEYFVDKNNPDIKNGSYMAYYANGKLLETSTFKSGKMEGERTLFFESGKIMVKEHYKNGNYEGVYQSFFDSGGKESEGQFADNARSGLWKLYYENPVNVLKQEVTFKDNMINGPFKEYYTNGKVNAEGNKVEIGDGIDVYDGKVQVYDSLGALEKTITYDKGRQTAKEESK